MILPPKRFEDQSDVIYDPIRGRGWFAALYRRRAKLPALQCAYDLWADGVGQAGASETMGVDERDLRDFISFVQGQTRPYDNQKTFQAIIDEAYRYYVENQAKFSFTCEISLVAPRYGVNARHAMEHWEVDPNLWPTGYKK